MKNRDLQGYEAVTGITDSAGNTWVSANRLTQGQSGGRGGVVQPPTRRRSVPTGSVTVTLSGDAAIAMTVLDVAGAAAQYPSTMPPARAMPSADASTGAASTSSQDIVIADIGWNANVNPNNQTGSFTTAPS